MKRTPEVLNSLIEKRVCDSAKHPIYAASEFADPARQPSAWESAQMESAFGDGEEDWGYCPHQDIIGKNGGLLQKVWYDHLTPKEVFSAAITKFQNEHERIKSNYFAH